MPPAQEVEQASFQRFQQLPNHDVATIKPPQIANEIVQTTDENLSINRKSWSTSYTHDFSFIPEFQEIPRIRLFIPPTSNIDGFFPLVLYLKTPKKIQQHGSSHSKQPELPPSRSKPTMLRPHRASRKAAKGDVHLRVALLLCNL